MQYSDMDKIHMVDLSRQLIPIREEIDQAIKEVLDQASFIQGPQVMAFERALEDYLQCRHVITCANGTDAIQIALMALDLEPGDEVLVPSFTYIAAIEAVVLLGLVPVCIDVEGDTFHINAALIEAAISKKTRAIIVVHLFGQMADMISILAIAKRYELWVIEDNAQGVGCRALGDQRRAGTLGHIGCTSFFPTKILGCMGDGGAITTHDDTLALKMRSIARHGQNKKYHHQRIGINSRLDTVQAAILAIKLRYVDEYISRRQASAYLYDRYLSEVQEVVCPYRSDYSDHVFHQYTIKVSASSRGGLQGYLLRHDIPTTIYYPIAIHQQRAYTQLLGAHRAPIAESLARQVLSLPMHTELLESQIRYICDTIRSFYI